MIKALVPFSGGLDSILVVKILEEQGVKVTGLSFDSYFFDSREAKKTADRLGIELLIKDISEKQLEKVKNPRYGHGSALNPCIDCHGLMFQIAGELAGLVKRKNEFDLVATGEVLGQRPFSQNKEALRKVEKLAGVEILRPLSAKLLPETIYEKEKLVNRKKLLDISGKSRKRQLELVKKYGIEYFPSPAGGCRLTENEFGIKVKKLLDNDGQMRKLGRVDFELLRTGRHYWLGQDMKKKQQVAKEKGERIKKNHIILGKNYEENERLKKFAQKKDGLLELKDLMGPTALLIDYANLSLEEQEQVLKKGKELVLERAKNPEGKKVMEVRWSIFGD
jgi:tRNA U34 2-thiouridine synthase MnmA/TrmU